MTRLLAASSVLFVPALAPAQGLPGKAETVKYVLACYDKESGAFKLTPTGQPGLRPVNGAAKALKYLGEKLPDPARTGTFVFKCYDPTTGGFAEPGGKPDVGTTAVGVMAAVEVGVPADKVSKAVEYLHRNAQTFEDVRIGAAALEALGQKPAWLGEWFKVADTQLREDGTAGEGDGVARDTASVIAMKLRLGVPRRALVNADKMDDVLQAGQWTDGGYGKAGAKGSDLESTYRVMRAFMLMRERPKDRAGLRAFIARCRNRDGGYGVKPGDPSSMSGVYYATIVTAWLDDLEK